MLKINSLLINNLAMILYDITGQELGLIFAAHCNGNAQVLHHWAEDLKPCPAVVHVRLLSSVCTHKHIPT